MFIITTAALLLLADLFLTGVVAIHECILRAMSPRETLPEPAGGTIENPQNFIAAILFPLYIFNSSLLGEWSIDTLYGVFVWSTLMGVFWIAVFSASVIIANLGIQVRGLGPWLEEYTKVRSQPFRNA
jgi:hypothetical protein